MQFIKCSPLTGGALCSGTLPAGAAMFPALRALNASLNNLSGPIPPQWGNTGLFKLPALLLSNGQAMAHVFNVSNNALTGSVPTFLNKVNLLNYQSAGVALAVRPPTCCMAGSHRHNNGETITSQTRPTRARKTHGNHTVFRLLSFWLLLPCWHTVHSSLAQKTCHGWHGFAPHWPAWQGVMSTFL